jgi:hypothetical protein
MVVAQRAAGRLLTSPGHRVGAQRLGQRGPQPGLVETAGDPDLQLNAPQRGLGV